MGSEMNNDLYTEYADVLIGRFISSVYNFGKLLGLCMHGHNYKYKPYMYKHPVYLYLGGWPDQSLYFGGKLHGGGRQVVRARGRLSFCHVSSLKVKCGR